MVVGCFIRTFPIKSFIGSDFQYCRIRQKSEINDPCQRCQKHLNQQIGEKKMLKNLINFFYDFVNVFKILQNEGQRYEFRMFL